MVSYNELTDVFDQDFSQYFPEQFIDDNRIALELRGRSGTFVYPDGRRSYTNHAAEDYLEIVESFGEDVNTTWPVAEKENENLKGIMYAIQEEDPLFAFLILD